LHRQMLCKWHYYQAGYLKNSDLTAALDLAVIACEIADKLVADRPGQPNFEWEMCAALTCRGGIERSLKKLPEAKKSLAASITLSEKLHAENPLDDDFAFRRLNSYRNAARVEQDLAQYESALELLNKAGQLLDALLSGDPNNKRALLSLAEVTGSTGDQLEQ